MLQRLFRSNLVWLLLNIGGSQILRLLGNLILTRLLVPEMFGLMALVTAIILGISMFSDVGIRGSIISNPRSGEPEFYNTAWTVQIVRGVLLYLILLAMAIPISRFYEIPQLALVIAVVGANTVVNGFMPTKVYWAYKELYLRRVSLLEFLAQLLGMVVMIALAYYYRNVWSLVAGMVTSSVAVIVLNYFFIPGHKNWLTWDKQSFVEIFKYGRWILLSTGSLYLITQGDRLVIGKFLTLETLGIYSIAINFSMIVNEIAENVSNKYLFPLYRKFIEGGPGQLYRIRMYRHRGMALGMLACVPFLFFGQMLIEFLYDDRYEKAGWMLNILTLAALFRLMDTTLRPIFLAHADSFRSMIYQVIKGIIFFPALVIGISNYGLQGLVIVLLLTPLLNLVVLNVMVRKYNYVWHYDDVLMLIAVIVVAVLGWQLLPVDPLDFLLTHQPGH